MSQEPAKEEQKAGRFLFFFYEVLEGKSRVGV